MERKAIVLREVCGCVVGVTVMDDDMRYLQTAAAWQRECAKKAGLMMETLTVEAAKEELSHTTAMMRRRGRHHWRARNITPKSCRALAVEERDVRAE